MAGWHHGLDGHEFEQAPVVGDGQGSLVCCSPWGHKESDTTDQLNNSNNNRWTSRLLPCPSYCKQWCGEHWGTCVSFSSSFFGVYVKQWDC